MGLKNGLLRLANRPLKSFGLRLLPEWQIQFGYSDRAALESDRKAELKRIKPRKASKINVGCGQDLRPGWLNLDPRPISPDSAEFLCCDLLLLDYYIEDGCADEILAQDILEHLSWREVNDVIRVLVKKLKLGGVFVIQSPNLDAILLAYQKNVLSHDEAQRLLYGDQTYPQNAHRNIFSPAEIKRRLEGAGLRVEQVEQVGYNVRAAGRK